MDYVCVCLCAVLMCDVIAFIGFYIVIEFKGSFVNIEISPNYTARMYINRNELYIIIVWNTSCHTLLWNNK